MDQARPPQPRGKGGKKSRKDAEESVSVDPGDTGEAEADNEEIDTLSDWNVPSWAELIASLYRPDR
jgi:hypothetical protein